MFFKNEFFPRFCLITLSEKQDEILPYDYFDNFYITFCNTTGKWNGLMQRRNSNFELFSTKIIKIETS